MTNQIYQLTITLTGSDPKIWRTILVHEETLLVDLHRIIQTTMGWTNSHLHMFKAKKNEYAPEEFGIEEAKNSREIPLHKILNKVNQHINYEYDFGDSWEHDIVLDKIMEESNNHIPCCIDGKMQCPPEDCGGIWGYPNLLKIIADPKHKDYKEMKAWLGKNFQPEYFNIPAINKLLKKKDFGCIWLE